MNNFILLENVDHEGSYFIGTFSCFNDIIEYLKSKHTKYFDHNNQFQKTHAYINKENCNASWWIKGKLDISYSIFQVEHSGE